MMNKKKDALYEENIYANDLSPKEKAISDMEFSELRLSLFKGKSKEEDLYWDMYILMRKIEMFLENPSFFPEMNFQYFLNEYLNRSQLKKEELAKALGLKIKNFDEILEGKIMVDFSIAFRLEAHSDQLISANKWIKILTISLNKNSEIKNAIKSKVTQKLELDKFKKRA